MGLNRSIKKLTIVGSVALALVVGVRIGYANNSFKIHNNEEVTNKNLIIEENKQQTNQQNKQETKHELNKEEALSIISKLNPELQYEYLGTEQEFETLKEKNVKGYVFLPQVDTDLAIFINKDTKEIYYYHPSGYMELIQK